MSTRFAVWILTRVDSNGHREALIGDLLEEIAHGRSPLWVWQQTLALCGVAFFAYARVRTRLTPQLVALGISVVLLAARAIAPTGQVLQTWALVYMCAGTLSLFGHVISSRTSNLGFPLRSVRHGVDHVVDA
jgi:hypothetical protein